MLVTASQEAGVIEEDEEQMLHRVFGFADLTAGQVMVPRTEMVAVAEDAPMDAVLHAVARGGHDRYPVYRERPRQHRRRTAPDGSAGRWWRAEAPWTSLPSHATPTRYRRRCRQTLCSAEMRRPQHTAGDRDRRVRRHGGARDLRRPHGAHRGFARARRRGRPHHGARRRVGARGRARARHRRERAIRGAHRRGPCTTRSAGTCSAGWGARAPIRRPHRGRAAARCASRRSTGFALRACSSPGRRRRRDEARRGYVVLSSLRPLATTSSEAPVSATIAIQSVA